MERSLSRFTLCFLGFAMTCLLNGCIELPAEQCGDKTLDYFVCTEEQGYKGYGGPPEEVVSMDDPATQTDKEAIIFGDSIVVGGMCQRTCGFKNALEGEIGLSIAGYGVADWAVRWEVDGGGPYNPGVGWPELSPQLWRSDQSIANNPGAERVYIHIGGNDLLHCYLKTKSAPLPQCSYMPWPPPPCTVPVGGELDIFLDQIVTNVQAVVENYQENLAPTPEIFLLSAGHFDPECGLFAFLGQRKYCINVLFDILRDKLMLMASTKGVHFVDLNDDDNDYLPAHRCTDDCIHIDCDGFPLIVQKILAPVF